MASEDVIELGSSDEESRPAKKIKAGPNAMVHIPKSIHGLTIKSTKSSAGLGGAKGQKLVTTNNATSLPTRNNAKTNGKKLLIVPHKSITIRKDLQKGIPISEKSIKPLNINPVNVVKKLNNSQIMVNKLRSPINVLKAPIPVKAPVSFKKNVINLPSTITVKKTLNLKRPAVTNVTGVKKKQKTNPTVREVLTIDSDDEETGKLVTTGPSGPQWYLRPEEQEDIKKQEEKNNTEPETSKFIEITIEDSPVKPVKDKRTCTVGTELAITIDDSPVKPKETSTSDKNKDTSNTPHSKKKLEYPVETFEIEIEPMEIVESDVLNENVQDHEKDPFGSIEKTKANKEHSIENKNKDVNTEEQSIIIEAESPAKKKNDSPVSMAKEAPSKVIDLDLEDDNTSSEFHPVYQQFIDLCLKIEDSIDMKTIVEKKIKSYYRQVPKEYTESEEFLDLVSGKILSMKAGPEKIYLYIKDIVDELNMQRKLAKQQILSKMKKKSAEEEKFLYGEDTEFDSKRQRQIRKLEKTLKKLHRAIQKLEEQEVDFDDEEDSVYLLTERYKERMVRVHAKLCQLTNTKMPSEPRVQIDARPGQPIGPAKRLEKWVNKKVPIGTPLPFPDFHDVLRCVREANDEDKLGWNEADIMEEARDLFIRCGKKLQRRRQENEWRLAASRISVDVDPAEENDGLKKKLEENRQLATKKEIEVFNKYADRQSLLKLEAEVVGDKEAEESPVESEEEEPIDDSCTMKNKERRKERLRRLLQEKPRHSDKNGSPQKVPNLNEVPDQINKNAIDIVNDASDVKKETEKSGIETKSQEEGEVENKVEKVHSISDSSENVGSDVDELHLLQKLHSGNEVDSSTSESSDSLIDISDTIQSDNDNNEKSQNDDVISIENSSYSDSERSNDGKNNKIECDDTMESSVTSKAKEAQENLVGKECDVGQVLTVSDEDRHNKEDNESQESDVACMNTQDDAISIGDTEIQGIKNRTTAICDVLESNSNSPKLEAGEINSCMGEYKNTKDDMLHEIAQRSIELNTLLNTDSSLVNDTEIMKKKVDEETDLNKKSDENERNKDETKITISNELTLSLNQDEMVLLNVGSQDADLSVKVTKPKHDDEKFPTEESDKNGKNKDETEISVRNESLNSEEDEIMLDKIDSQDAGHKHTEICSTAEKSINNDNKIVNKDSFNPEIDKLVEQSCCENNTEILSRKVADVNEETLAVSNDEPNCKTDSAKSNIALNDRDLSENNINSDFKQTDSLDSMLKEFFSDLNSN